MYRSEKSDALQIYDVTGNPHLISSEQGPPLEVTNNFFNFNGLFSHFQQFYFVCASRERGSKRVPADEDRSMEALWVAHADVVKRLDEMTASFDSLTAELQQEFILARSSASCKTCCIIERRADTLWPPSPDSEATQRIRPCEFSARNGGNLRILRPILSIGEARKKPRKRKLLLMLAMSARFCGASAELEMEKKRGSSVARKLD
ncbi:hypothetical protein M5K25_026209 [Dendrobium thyrsiflorum]|uniref:Uncharacterized protein n=1 Tax=Dendrobium thyrsiflorum TaxID=117978 RepID=A0ABD0TWW3_DENTH